MSQVTRFNGDYNITGADASGNVIVTANTLLVNGNLVVSGGVSSITSTETHIADNVITLNSGETGAGVTMVTAGVDVARGQLTTASIYWNESPGVHVVDGQFVPIPPRWEITDSTGTFYPIATSETFRVANDDAPQLGGDLNTNGRSIYDSTGPLVSFNNAIAISNTAEVPTMAVDQTAIYAQAPGGGGSGVFVLNDTAKGEELITKSKAIVFALIM